MKNRVFKVFLIIFLAFLGIMLILLSPLFNISSISMSGNKRLTESYIKETAGIDDKTNIFSFNPRKAKKALKTNHYIEDVEIKKSFTNKSVSIKIYERILSGYIEHESGAYLYIDENGRVLETSSQLDDKLPIVVGLNFETFTIGELLSVKSQESFNNLVTLAHIFNKYEMSMDVIKVDLRDPDNTHIFINNIDVELGGISDADEKISTLKGMLKSDLLTNPDVKGFIDLKDKNKRPIFRILT